MSFRRRISVSVFGPGREVIPSTIPWLLNRINVRPILRRDVAQSGPGVTLATRSSPRVNRVGAVTSRASVAIDERRYRRYP
jgi:hypothetical protein